MPPKSKILPDGTKPCSRCASVKPLTMFYTTGKTVNGNIKWGSWCKSCMSKKMSAYHQRTWGPQGLAFKSYQRSKTPRAYLAYLRAKAAARKDCVVSLDDLERLYISQDGRCAISGIPMTRVLGKGRIPTNISIDRIDSSQGYTQGNVQLVCSQVNVCKSDMSQNAFIALCRTIAEANRGVQDTGVAAI